MVKQIGLHTFEVSRNVDTIELKLILLDNKMILTKDVTITLKKLEGKLKTYSTYSVLEDLVTAYTHDTTVEFLQSTDEEALLCL